MYKQRKMQVYWHPEKNTFIFQQLYENIKML